MQTFLPYSDFTASAKSLDRQRLGKQRVETFQILKALSGCTKGWSNHPAAKMWEGFEFTLLKYGLAICDEWKSRGYKDTCAEKMLLLAAQYSENWGSGTPGWLGDLEFHRSHQSNLISKNPDYYAHQFAGVEGGLPYIWPIAEKV